MILLADRACSPFGARWTWLFSPCRCRSASSARRSGGEHLADELSCALSGEQAGTTGAIALRQSLPVSAASRCRNEVLGRGTGELDYRRDGRPLRAMTARWTPPSPPRAAGSGAVTSRTASPSPLSTVDAGEPKACSSVVAGRVAATTARLAGAAAPGRDRPCG